MTADPLRERPWPDGALGTEAAVLEFLEFLHTTAVNKLAGLREDQARHAPLPTSPSVSALGIVKHLTAVQRQHVQIHIGRADLPLLWSHDDTTAEFRIAPGETVAGVVAAFDTEWATSRDTLTAADWTLTTEAYGRPVVIGRLVVDVLQETARHVGQLDVLRELLDGSTGE
jgi:hypothetical protein